MSQLQNETLNSNPPTIAFWRRTPPALFPTLFGLLGLGMSWRVATLFAPDLISVWIGNAILAIASLLYLVVLGCYLAKFGARPRVLLEDMATVPGRAGIAAMSLGLLLFAAVIYPVSTTVATVALFAGLALHSCIAALALVKMLRSPQGLVVSPAWHLNFVGFIIAPLSAVALGYIGLSQVILAITIAVAALIYAVSALQLGKSQMPAPLRPLLAIHLAPLSLFTSVASLLQLGWLALGFGVLALALFLLLAVRLRFLIAAGFSPLWGAFTFPIAAFSSALFALSVQLPLFGWLAFIPLFIVSVLTPFVAVRVLEMWSNGVLATKTGAAVA